MKSSLIFALAPVLLSACEPEPAASRSAASTSGELSAPTEAKQARRVNEPSIKPSPAPRKKEPGRSEAFGDRPEGVGLAIGSAVPQAELLSLEGKSVQFTEVVGGGPALVIFYRGGWCPYCNFQIHALTKAAAEFDGRGVSLVAVSVDAPSSAEKTKGAYEIPFQVLSDPELALHKAFHVLNQVDDAYIEKLESMNIDIEAASGKKHHTMAVPSVFLLADGKVAFAHAEKNYRVRPSVQQLLKMLDENGYPNPEGKERP